MAHTYTEYLNLLKLDPNVAMELADFRRVFQADRDTIDTKIKALEDRIKAVAEAGKTLVAPISIAPSALKFHIENAANLFDLVTMLGNLPLGTPVRVTGFIMTLTSVEAVVGFYEILDRLNGLDASDNGLDKAQMHGKIFLQNASSPITVTGAQLKSWKDRYASITVQPDKILNYIYYYSYDGSRRFSAYAVYDEADSGYAGVPPHGDAEDGYMYSFMGWSTEANATEATPGITEHVTEERTVYAAYQYRQIVAPTITVLSNPLIAGENVTVRINSMGTFDHLKGFNYNRVNSISYTIDYPGDTTVSMDGDTVTINCYAAIFAGFNHALVFADEYASNTIYVPFSINNNPVMVCTQKCMESGGYAYVQIANWGLYKKISAFIYTANKASSATTSTTAYEFINENTVRIAMSSAIYQGSAYKFQFDDNNSNTLEVPLPDIR